MHAYKASYISMFISKFIQPKPCFLYLFVHQNPRRLCWYYFFLQRFSNRGKSRPLQQWEYFHNLELVQSTSWSTAATELSWVHVPSQLRKMGFVKKSCCSQAWIIVSLPNIDCINLDLSARAQLGRCKSGVYCITDRYRHRHVHTHTSSSCKLWVDPENATGKDQLVKLYPSLYVRTSLLAPASNGEEGIQRWTTTSLLFSSLFNKVWQWLIMLSSLSARTYVGTSRGVVV